MRQPVLPLAGFLLAFFFCFLTAHATPRAALRTYGEVEKKQMVRLKTIVLDPGHGGKDEGAKGPSLLKEKNVVLRISLKLRRMLTAAGFRVLMTRQDDTYRSLQERARMVNAQAADFFLSIHANAASNKLAQGYETFYLSDQSNDPYDPDRAGEDGNWRYEHFMDTQRDVGKVYLSLLDKASSDDRGKSIDLAEMVHEAMRGRLSSPDRGVKRARFFVLKQTEIPAVLIEVGFLSNPGDEKLLRSPRYQHEIARAIAEGVISFRRHQDSANRVVER